MDVHRARLYVGMDIPHLFQKRAAGLGTPPVFQEVDQQAKFKRRKVDGSAIDPDLVGLGVYHQTAELDLPCLPMARWTAAQHHLNAQKQFPYR